MITRLWKRLLASTPSIVPPPPYGPHSPKRTSDTPTTPPPGRDFPFDVPLGDVSERCCPSCWMERLHATSGRASRYFPPDWRCYKTVAFSNEGIEIVEWKLICNRCGFSMEFVRSYRRKADEQ